MDKLTLPLPPSVNAAFTFNPYIHALAHTRAAKTYLEVEAWTVNAYCRKHEIDPIEDYREIKLWFYLRRKNSDSHNYKKLLFDVLQKGGLFKDDRYILDNTVSIEIDSKNPRVEIELSTFQKKEKEL